jgi:hypothetical protein
MRYVRRDRSVMDTPFPYGYISEGLGARFERSRKVLEMVKVAFCAVLASWMTGCLMAIVYSREIAVFIVERMQ